MDLYRVVTCSEQKVEGKTKVDGEDATYLQDVTTVELEAENQHAGTLKLVFVGKAGKAALDRFKIGAVFTLPPLADASATDVAASRFAPTKEAKEPTPPAHAAKK